MTTPAFVLTEKVADTTTSTGTGPFVVSGTGPTGFKSPSSCMSSGDFTFLRIDDGTNWEVVFAKYTGSNSFDVYGILSTSAGNRTPVSFAAGSKTAEMVAAGGISSAVQFYEKFGDGSDGPFTPGASGTTQFDGVSVPASGGIPCYTTVGPWPASSTAKLNTNALHFKCWVLNTINAPSFALEPTPTNAQNASGVGAPASNGGMSSISLGVGDPSTAGASGGTTATGSNGANGSFPNISNGGASGAGGHGGNGATHNGGTGGGGGTPTPWPSKSPNPQQFGIKGGSFGLLGGGAAGGVGGGGGGNGTTGGGGSGGAGGGGNVQDIMAACIIRDGSTAVAAIASRGGNGGNGFSIGTATAGGGSGSGGGGGGSCTVGFCALGNAINGTTNTAVSGLISCAGGTGGNGGNGNTTGKGGDGGAGGNGGRCTLWDFGAQSGPMKLETLGSAPTVAPTTGAVTAGGTGGNAGVCSVTL